MNGYLMSSAGLLLLCHFAQGRQGEPTWIVMFGLACALAGFGANVALTERRNRKAGK